jgi:cytochrome c-type protein NapB
VEIPIMMKTTLKFSLAALLSVAACWSTAQTVSAMRSSEVPAVDKAPEIQPYLGSKPGGHALIQRTFQQQPPLVPHKVEGFDDITNEDNVCLDCHIHKEVRGQKIPQVKESHLVKPVNPAAPELHKSRWQCNSCHVPQIDAKPLVENVFKGNTAAK